MCGIIEKFGVKVLGEFVKLYFCIVYEVVFEMGKLDELLLKLLLLKMEW